MLEELASIEENGTWTLTDLPAGHTASGLKWVFKLKKDAAGAIVKHKARLVARGFVQKEGVDYDDAFAPVARLDSVRVMVGMAAQRGWELHHLDVKSAFLNGEHKEEVDGGRAPSSRLRNQLRRRDRGDGEWMTPCFVLSFAAVP